MKTAKKEIPAGGRKPTPDPADNARVNVVDYRSIVAVVKNGIASRKFYIVTSPGQIPGYRQSGNGGSLECVQRFAEANHWHVTVNNENGWLIFTAEELPLAKGFENIFGQLAEWIESSLRASHMTNNGHSCSF